MGHDEKGKVMAGSIILKCSCGNPNCIEEMTVTRWEDGTITFFCFEVDLTKKQVGDLITFLKHDEEMLKGGK